MNKNERNIEYVEKTSTLIGSRQRELIDAETGEHMRVQQTTKLVYGSKNFWKCYMKEFLAVMKSLSGKQFNVFVYIIEHTKQSDNVFIGTYDKIVDDTKCSRQTVAAAMKTLQKKNFIKKRQNGVWMMNPDILMKGNDIKRMGLISEYEKIQPVNDEGKDGAQSAKDKGNDGAQPTNDERKDGADT